MALHHFEKTVRVLDREMSYILAPVRQKWTITTASTGSKIWSKAVLENSIRTLWSGIHPQEMNIEKT